ncbi:hypothetical protein WN943_006676 [Citrus x changshan-huyou]
MPVLNSVKALQRTRLFASLDKGGDHSKEPPKELSPFYSMDYLLKFKGQFEEGPMSRMRTFCFVASLVKRFKARPSIENRNRRKRTERFFWIVKSLNYIEPSDSNLKKSPRKKNWTTTTGKQKILSTTRPRILAPVTELATRA